MTFAAAPIPGTSRQHGPCLLLALTRMHDAIIVTDDGQLELVALSDVKVDMRYDYAKADWVDVSGFGEDDADHETQTSNDRDQEVSRDVPDTD